MVGQLLEEFAQDKGDELAQVTCGFAQWQTGLVVQDGAEELESRDLEVETLGLGFDCLAVHEADDAAELLIGGESAVS